ncbi:putative nuclease HARBI1 [Rhagoletis pomonella]|uniref:putative nuclease HARBI1 n=1 Tax=Rhagoletis pomonella TaxID=28610 RepID=UPI001786B6BA|nr:putative nuclease HARBI1 [Rhagoletis pomonella]
MDKKKVMERKQIVSALMIAMESSSSESDSESENEEELAIMQKLSTNHDLYSNILLLFRERQPRNCVINYIEQTVPTYTEREFRMHFRISKSLFENLSERFLVSDFYCNLRGCIDGMHIRIDPPSKGKDDYIDRKGITSICLQAVCNENKKFLNIFVGYPGSCHDSWVFKNSTLYNKLPSYCKDYYLLGDSAYPCNKYLITPYKDNGHLTNANKLFNIKLSSGRIAIEHSFRILKQRFRQLYHCKLRGMKKLCHFVRACCVLHNIADEGDLEFTAEATPELNEEIAVHGEVARGNSVRDSICRDIQLRRNQNV